VDSSATLQRIRWRKPLPRLLRRASQADTGVSTASQRRWVGRRVTWGVDYGRLYGTPVGWQGLGDARGAHNASSRCGPRTGIPVFQSTLAPRRQRPPAAGWSVARLIAFPGYNPAASQTARIRRLRALPAWSPDIARRVAGQHGALLKNSSFRGACPGCSRRDRRESRNFTGPDREIPWCDSAHHRPLRFAPVGMTARLG
jgi:hypothetical protein